MPQHLNKLRVLIALIAISFSAYAQAPNLLNYQGVARNAVGNPLPNQTMNLRLSVHNLMASGATVYTETRVIKTNLGGLFSVQIGSAGSTSATGTIDAVNWLSGDKYLQVEIDPASNNNYLNMGTVQLVSVPYAFSAGTAGNSATVTTNANLTGSVTSIGNTTSIAASPALTGVPTAPTAAPGTNTNQIATTEFVKAAALTGPTGAKGVQGLAGADGAAGAQGIQGLAGAAGAAGSQGIQGLTGSVANVAAISGTSTANGASIISGELSLAPADATNGGIVTTGAQIFAGAKTFNTIITGSINGNATTATTATTSGTASTAIKLATARNINGVAFDGSSDVTIPATGAVPYTGATQGVDLGAFDLKVNGLTVGTGTGSLAASNTVIGNSALLANTAGQENTAIGFISLYANTTGSSNTATGAYALLNNTEGTFNTANGVSALNSNTSGSYNAANGGQSLNSNTTGEANTAEGMNSLYYNRTGSSNTATGFFALSANTTGSNNTANGKNSLNANTTGIRNTAIGDRADVGSGALTNATAIGSGATVLASNTIQLGDANVAKVITSGTLTAGTVTYPNISGTANQVLTTNGLGTASWQALTAADAGTLTGTTLNATVTGSSLTSVGTITSGVWSGMTIAVAKGGTGTTNGSITGTGALTFAAGGSNQNISIRPSGSGSVGVGTSSPASSAVLEASSTTQGFLPPRMTRSQRNNITTPASGLVVWCNNCGAVGELQVYSENATWTNLSGTTAAGVYTPTIGEAYQGGKVAYVLQSGDPGYDATIPHGLIAANSDQSALIMWDNGPNVITGATGIDIGTGLSNTNKIISIQGGTSTSYAAGLARAHNGGGYTDWYLPSQEELAKLYAMHLLGFGGFTAYLYWSSTELDIGNARLYYFVDGTLKRNSKGGSTRVRAIRAF